MALSKRTMTLLNWGEILGLVKVKYGLRIKDDLEDAWEEWTAGSNCDFFSVDKNNLFYPTYEWMRILAKTLYDNGIGINEEVYIYAND